MTYKQYKEPTWHGSEEEAIDLREALKRHCQCRIDELDQRITFTCPGHLMLFNDQRALDGLLWERHRAGEILDQEFIGPKGDARVTLHKEPIA